jgi:uncharacterized protein (TIGR02118 family)
MYLHENSLSRFVQAIANRRTLAFMIRVTVTYPSAEGSTFDHDYYQNTHVPLCRTSWPAVTSAQIDKGINGPSVAAVHFTFDSMEAFQASMGSEATAAVMADVANYTNIAPVMQISEIVG